MPSILNPQFRYISAAHTDIRKTIRREQKRLADLKAAQETTDAEASRKVKPLIKAKAQ